LKLYSEDLNKIKLVKYHVSNSVAIFFFIYRSDEYLDDKLSPKEDEGGESYGVHFFVIKSIQQLKLIA
jgi:hypothetical protein